MKSRKLKIISLVLFTSCLVQLHSRSFAQSLPNECAIIISGNNSEAYLITDSNNQIDSNYPFLSLNPKICKDLKSLGESMQIISGLLSPIAVFAASPVILNALSAQAISLGISMANPVVLSIVVFGGMGLNTIYFIYQKTMKECTELDQQILKKQIIEELKYKYNLVPSDKAQILINLNK